MGTLTHTHKHTHTHTHKHAHTRTNKTNKQTNKLLASNDPHPPIKKPSATFNENPCVKINITFYVVHQNRSTSSTFDENPCRFLKKDTKMLKNNYVFHQHRSKN